MKTTWDDTISIGVEAVDKERLLDEISSLESDDHKKYHQEFRDKVTEIKNMMVKKLEIQI